MNISRIVIPGLVLMLGMSPFTLSAAEQKTAVERPAVMSAKASRTLLIDITAAGNRLVAVGDRGHILYSDDQGKTWTQASVPVSVLLTSVYFSNAQEGWAVGHNGVILYSSDAGQNWQLQHDDSKGTAGKEGAPLLGVWFANNQEGFAVGAYGYFLTTHDGGITWSDSSELLTNPDEVHLNAVKGSADGNTVFIAGEGGILLRSLDRGQTWSALKSPFDGSFFGIAPIGEYQWLAYGLQGRLFVTSDNGNSWSRIQTGVTSGINAAARLPDGEVIVVGNAGVVLRAKDASFEMIPETRSDRQSITALAALANGGIVTVGEGGAKTISAAGQ